MSATTSPRGENDTSWALDMIGMLGPNLTDRTATLFSTAGFFNFANFLVILLDKNVANSGASCKLQKNLPNTAFTKSDDMCECGSREGGNCCWVVVVVVVVGVVVVVVVVVGRPPAKNDGGVGDDDGVMGGDDVVIGEGACECEWAGPEPRVGG
jgi:hypothetical protein